MLPQCFSLYIIGVQGKSIKGLTLTLKVYKKHLQNLFSGLHCLGFFTVCVIWLFRLTEEILQTHIAHWWSPDGLRLAYMTINDTLVPKMEVPFFTGAPYPASLEYHYPKASLQPASQLF